MTDENAKFSIRLLEQHWLGNEPDQFDLCSHGRMRITIGDKVIIDGRETLGVSETALALLRTTKADHSPQKHLAEKLVYHGCGYVLMKGCPIGADWTVLHESEEVILKDVYRWDFPDENLPTRFGALSVTMPLDEYKAVVFAFAREVKAFFEGKEKAFYSEEDRIAYEDFWAEFDALLAA